MATHLADPVDLDHVRVLHAGDGPRLSLEPLPLRFVHRHAQEERQRDWAVEVEVVGEVDLAHASAADLLDQSELVNGRWRLPGSAQDVRSFSTSILYCFILYMNVRMGMAIRRAASVWFPFASWSASTIRRRSSSWISSLMGRNMQSARSSGTSPRSGTARVGGRAS